MQSLQMQLLHLLQEDCRLPLEKLAVMTGSTVETVATVIDDMERSGIILRYAPVINWDKTDRERVEAMIGGDGWSEVSNTRARIGCIHPCHALGPQINGTYAHVGF